MSIVAAATSQAAETSTWEQSTVFWVCAILSVLGAIGMVVSRKAVHSALWVAVTMISLAVLYVALQAPFLGMVQVIVYTGAVMMLFLFVLMVVGVDSSDSLVETIRGQRWLAILFALGVGISLIAAEGNALVGPAVGLDAANTVDGGNIEALARLMFGRYVLAFEVTSALLISAALGAMILAHRERHTPRLTQPQLAEARFLEAGPKGNKPVPGVYARHNAVDTPALLPDGSISIDSVPGPLRARGALRPVERANLDEVTDVFEGEPVLTATPQPDDEGVR